MSSMPPTTDTAACGTGTRETTSRQSIEDEACLRHSDMSSAPAGWAQAATAAESPSARSS
jgi:hypothetical protein